MTVELIGEQFFFTPVRFLVLAVDIVPIVPLLVIDQCSVYCPLVQGILVIGEERALVGRLCYCLNQQCAMERRVIQR